MPIKCWSCGAETMELRPAKRNYECPCGATENVDGTSIPKPEEKKKGGKKNG